MNLGEEFCVKNVLSFLKLAAKEVAICFVNHTLLSDNYLHQNIYESDCYKYSILLLLHYIIFRTVSTDYIAWILDNFQRGRNSQTLTIFLSNMHEESNLCKPILKEVINSINSQ